MDAGQITTIVVSGVTLGASGVMILVALHQHRRSLRAGGGFVRIHRLTRRRVTMGIALAVVAVMLFLGTCVIDFRGSPRALTWFWLAVLGLLVWILVMAVCDVLAVLYGRPGPPPPEGGRT